MVKAKKIYKITPHLKNEDYISSMREGAESLSPNKQISNFVRIVRYSLFFCVFIFAFFKLFMVSIL